MRKTFVRRMLLLFTLLGALFAAHEPQLEAAKRGPRTKSARTAEKYGRLPLRFERNEGQADERVKYLARGRGYTLLLTETEALLSTSNDDPSLLRMRLGGAQAAARIEPENQLATKTTYLIGNDPARWRKDVPSYERGRYCEVYPGIDVVYYGRERELEFDFLVAPGADAGAIGMIFEGALRDRPKQASGIQTREI